MEGARGRAGAAGARGERGPDRLATGSHVSAERGGKGGGGLDFASGRPTRAPRMLRFHLASLGASCPSLGVLLGRGTEFQRIWGDIHPIGVVRSGRRWPPGGCCEEGVPILGLGRWMTSTSWHSAGVPSASDPVRRGPVISTEFTQVRHPG